MPAKTPSPVNEALPENAVRPVPFFTQSSTFAELWPSISAGVEEIFENGKFSHGGQVARFEQRLAEYTGARHAIGVNSGTDALVLLLRACGLAPGDEVLVPAFSFVASASSVVLAGGVPRFTDIDPVTYAMDPAAAAGAVGSATRFVMPVHLFSHQADLRALGELARRHELVVVEDSAEAIGMRQGGRHAALHGAGGVLSFFPSKTLGAIGDAGAVLTDRPEIAERVAALRHHGRGGRTLDHFPGISNETAEPGMNSKMDDIQAAVLLAKLGRLESDIVRRAELASAYSERLRDIPGIIRMPLVTSPSDDYRDVFYVYLIEVENRDELASHLAANGVGTETYYPVPLPFQPCFADLGYRAGQFPNAEAACARALALPLYPDLERAQVDQVCDAIRSFYLGRVR